MNLTDHFRKALADVRDKTLAQAAQVAQAEISRAESRGRESVLAVFGETLLKALPSLIGGGSHNHPAGATIARPDAIAALLRKSGGWDEAKHSRADDGKFGSGGVSPADSAGDTGATNTRGAAVTAAIDAMPRAGRAMGVDRIAALCATAIDRIASAPDRKAAYQTLRDMRRGVRQAVRESERRLVAGAVERVKAWAATADTSPAVRKRLAAAMRVAIHDDSGDMIRWGEMSPASDFESATGRLRHDGRDGWETAADSLAELGAAVASTVPTIDPRFGHVNPVVARHMKEPPTPEDQLRQAAESMLDDDYLDEALNDHLGYGDLPDDQLDARHDAIRAAKIAHVAGLLAAWDEFAAPPGREGKAFGAKERLARIATEEGLGEVLRWVKADDPWEYADLLAVCESEWNLERLTKADRSGLVRTIITNRLGRRQVVYRRRAEGEEDIRGASRGQAAHEDTPAHDGGQVALTQEQKHESRTLVAKAVSDPNSLNPEQLQDLAAHINAVTKEEAKGLLRVLGEKLGGDQMAVAKRLLEAVRARREQGKGVGDALKRQGIRTSGQYGAWGQAAGGTGGKPEASRDQFPKRGVGPGEKENVPQVEPEGTQADKPPALASPKVSPDEAKAFKDYSEEAYVDINAALRDGDELTGRDKEIADHLSNVIRTRGKLAQPVDVYRAMSWSHKQDAEAFLANAKPGETMTLPGFQSTSTDREFTEQNYGNRAGGAVLMKIRATHGVPMSGDMTHHERAGEVLLDKNSRFKVVSRREENGKTVLEVEQVLAEQPAATAEPKEAKAPQPPAAPAHGLTDDDGTPMEFKRGHSTTAAAHLADLKAAGRDTSAVEVALANAHDSEHDGETSDRDHKRKLVRLLSGAHRDAVRLGKEDAAGAADETLRKVGAEAIGEKGSVVPFDPARHESDSSHGKGEMVKVERVGHTLTDGGQEYIAGKAKVGKVSQEAGGAGKPPSPPPPVATGGDGPGSGWEAAYNAAYDKHQASGLTRHASRERAIADTLRAGHDVPDEVVNEYPDLVATKTRMTLQKRHGSDYGSRLAEMSKNVGRIHEVMTDHGGGKLTVRRKQVSGGGFEEHKKGDILDTADGPKVVSAVGKPYRGTGDGQTTGYFQTITLRDPKKAEAEAARRAVAAKRAHTMRVTDPDYSTHVAAAFGETRTGA